MAWKPSGLLNEWQLKALREIENVCIDYPPLNDAVSRILNFHSVRAANHDPGFVALVGGTGSGKTTTLGLVHRCLCQDAPPDSLRVVRFTTPVKCTRKALVSNLLTALGDPAPGRGTMENMLARIRNLVKHRGVELIIAEEVQHLVSRTNQLVNYDMADLLKVLMDELRVPFVLSGLDSLNRVIEANDQLHRRMYVRIECRPFSLQSNEDRRMVTEFLAMYDRALPFPEYCGLAQGDLRDVLLHVSGGYVGRFCIVVKLAAEYAILENARRIETCHLERAWEAQRNPSSRRERNPFSGIAAPPIRPKLHRDSVA